jgi:hypothetical protein
MSLPSFPKNTGITREDAINQILSSIAMEELGLSHILNAEGEKLQYTLGTLPGVNSPKATIEDLLAVNGSVKGLLEAAAKNQQTLSEKLEIVLSAANPENPLCPVRPVPVLDYGAITVAENWDSKFYPTKADHSLIVSGAQYVAPGDGWLFIVIDVLTSAPGTLQYQVIANGKAVTYHTMVGSYPSMTNFAIPISGGDTVRLGLMAPVDGNVTYGRDTVMNYIPYKSQVRRVTVRPS